MRETYEAKVTQRRERDKKESMRRFPTTEKIEEGLIELEERMKKTNWSAKYEYSLRNNSYSAEQSLRYYAKTMEMYFDLKRLEESKQRVIALYEKYNPKRI